MNMEHDKNPDVQCTQLELPHCGMAETASRRGAPPKFYIGACCGKEITGVDARTFSQDDMHGIVCGWIIGKYPQITTDNDGLIAEMLSAGSVTTEDLALAVEIHVLQELVKAQSSVVAIWASLLSNSDLAAVRQQADTRKKVEAMHQAALQAELTDKETKLTNLTKKTNGWKKKINQRQGTQECIARKFLLSLKDADKKGAERIEHDLASSYKICESRGRQQCNNSKLFRQLKDGGNLNVRSFQYGEPPGAIPTLTYELHFSSALQIAGPESLGRLSSGARTVYCHICRQVLNNNRQLMSLKNASSIPILSIALTRIGVNITKDARIGAVAQVIGSLHCKQCIEKGIGWLNTYAALHPNSLVAKAIQLHVAQGHYQIERTVLVTNGDEAEGGDEAFNQQLEEETKTGMDSDDEEEPVTAPPAMDIFFESMHDLNMDESTQIEVFIVHALLSSTQGIVSVREIWEKTKHLQTPYYQGNLYRFVVRVLIPRLNDLSVDDVRLVAKGCPALKAKLQYHNLRDGWLQYDGPIPFVTSEPWLDEKNLLMLGKALHGESRKYARLCHLLDKSKSVHALSVIQEMTLESAGVLLIHGVDASLSLQADVNRRTLGGAISMPEALAHDTSGDYVGIEAADDISAFRKAMEALGEAGDALFDSAKPLVPIMSSILRWAMDHHRRNSNSYVNAGALINAYATMSTSSRQSPFLSQMAASEAVYHSSKDDRLLMLHQMGVCVPAPKFRDIVNEQQERHANPYKLSEIIDKARGLAPGTTMPTIIQIRNILQRLASASKCSIADLKTVLTAADRHDRKYWVDLFAAIIDNLNKLMKGETKTRNAALNYLAQIFVCKPIPMTVDEMLELYGEDGQGTVFADDIESRAMRSFGKGATSGGLVGGDYVSFKDRFAEDQAEAEGIHTEYLLAMLQHVIHNEIDCQVSVSHFAALLVEAKEASTKDLEIATTASRIALELPDEDILKKSKVSKTKREENAAKLHDSSLHDADMVKEALQAVITKNVEQFREKYRVGQHASKQPMTRDFVFVLLKMTPSDANSVESLMDPLLELADRASSLVTHNKIKVDRFPVIADQQIHKLGNDMVLKATRDSALWNFIFFEGQWHMKMQNAVSVLMMMGQSHFDSLSASIHQEESREGDMRWQTADEMANLGNERVLRDHFNHFVLSIASCHERDTETPFVVPADIDTLIREMTADIDTLSPLTDADSKNKLATTKKVCAFLTANRCTYPNINMFGMDGEEQKTEDVLQEAKEERKEAEELLQETKEERPTPAAFDPAYDIYANDNQCRLQVLMLMLGQFRLRQRQPIGVHHHSIPAKFLPIFDALRFQDFIEGQVNVPSTNVFLDVGVTYEEGVDAIRGDNSRHAFAAETKTAMNYPSTNKTKYLPLFLFSRAIYHQLSPTQKMIRMHYYGIGSVVGHFQAFDELLEATFNLWYKTVFDHLPVDKMNKMCGMVPGLRQRLHVTMDQSLNEKSVYALVQTSTVSKRKTRASRATEQQVIKEFIRVTTGNNDILNWSTTVSNDVVVALVGLQAGVVTAPAPSSSMSIRRYKPSWRFSRGDAILGRTGFLPKNETDYAIALNINVRRSYQRQWLLQQLAMNANFGGDGIILSHVLGENDVLTAEGHAMRLGKQVIGTNLKVQNEAITTEHRNYKDTRILQMKEVLEQMESNRRTWFYAPEVSPTGAVKGPFTPYYNGNLISRENRMITEAIEEQRLMSLSENAKESVQKLTRILGRLKKQDILSTHFLHTLYPHAFITQTKTTIMLARTSPLQVITTLLSSMSIPNKLNVEGCGTRAFPKAVAKNRVAELLPPSSEKDIMLIDQDYLMRNGVYQKPATTIRGLAVNMLEVLVGYFLRCDSLECMYVACQDNKSIEAASNSYNISTNRTIVSEFTATILKEDGTIEIATTSTDVQSKYMLREEYYQYVVSYLVFNFKTVMKQFWYSLKADKQFAVRARLEIGCKFSFDNYADYTWQQVGVDPANLRTNIYQDHVHNHNIFTVGIVPPAVSERGKADRGLIFRFCFCSGHPEVQANDNVVSFEPDMRPRIQILKGDDRKNATYTPFAVCTGLDTAASRISSAATGWLDGRVVRTRNHVMEGQGSFLVRQNLLFVSDKLETLLGVMIGMAEIGTDCFSLLDIDHDDDVTTTVTYRHAFFELKFDAAFWESLDCTPLGPHRRDNVMTRQEKLVAFVTISSTYANDFAPPLAMFAPTNKGFKFFTESVDHMEMYTGRARDSQYEAYEEVYVAVTGLTINKTFIAMLDAFCFVRANFGTVYQNATATYAAQLVEAHGPTYRCKNPADLIADIVEKLASRKSQDAYAPPSDDGLGPRHTSIARAIACLASQTVVRRGEGSTISQLHQELAPEFNFGTDKHWNTIPVWYEGHEWRALIITGQLFVLRSPDRLVVLAIYCTCTTLVCSIYCLCSRFYQRCNGACLRASLGPARNYAQPASLEQTIEYCQTCLASSATVSIPGYDHPYGSIASDFAGARVVVTPEQLGYVPGVETTGGGASEALVAGARVAVYSDKVSTVSKQLLGYGTITGTATKSQRYWSDAQILNLKHDGLVDGSGHVTVTAQRREVLLTRFPNGMSVKIPHIKNYFIASTAFQKVFSRNLHDVRILVQNDHMMVSRDTVAEEDINTEDEEEKEEGEGGRESDDEGEAEAAILGLAGDDGDCG